MKKTNSKKTAVKAKRERAGEACPVVEQECRFYIPLVDTPAYVFGLEILASFGADEPIEISMNVLEPAKSHDVIDVGENITIGQARAIRDALDKAIAFAEGKQLAESGRIVEIPVDFANELLGFVIREASGWLVTGAGSSLSPAELYKKCLDGVTELRDDCLGEDAEYLYQDMLIAHRLATLMGRTNFPHPSVCDKQEGTPANQPMVRAPEDVIRWTFMDQLRALHDLAGDLSEDGIEEGANPLKVYYESLENHAKTPSGEQCGGVIPLAKSIKAFASALGENGFSDPEEYVALIGKAASRKKK